MLYVNLAVLMPFYAGMLNSGGWPTVGNPTLQYLAGASVNRTARSPTWCCCHCLIWCCCFQLDGCVSLVVLVCLNRACYKTCVPFNIRSIACSGPRDHNCCKVSAVHLSGGATPPSPAGYSWWMTRWKLLAGQAQHHAISHATNGDDGVPPNLCE